jgi:serine/threonine-protein kinase
MSPELIASAAPIIDARVDAWALGVMLYESISGILPTAGEGIAQVFKAIAARPIWPLIEAAPSAPTDLAAMVDRMLLRDVSRRLVDLDAVGEVLARHLDDATERDAAALAPTLARDGKANEQDRRAPTRRSDAPPPALKDDTASLPTVQVTGGDSDEASELVLRRGALVADRFRLERELGRGGMGTVWLARHEKLSVRCAVKFLIEQRPEEAKVALARFEREAKAVAQLVSPHVVRVLDFGLCRGRPYLAMEYLEGEDLATRLERERRLGARATIDVVSAIARGLAAAHAAGIVHRDLKPANIFVAREHGGEVVKILDFGIAKSMLVSGADTEMTRTGALLGTPSYMSPEQAHGTRDVDARADLWSLAVIAYRCVTGALPFKGAALGDLLLQIMTRPLPVPSNDRRDVPRAFDAWWRRAADRDPDKRFQSAMELSESLERALLKDESPDRASPRWALPALAALLAGLGAVGVSRTAGIAASTEVATSASTLAASPLASPEAILACPILEARGVTAPTGWLGAAAADLACRRAAWLLGGRVERTRSPAELLDLPPLPSSGFAIDPFTDPTARDRSVAAARRVGQAFVDGSITRDKDDFIVALALKSSHDVSLALGTGKGRDPALYNAVAKALDGFTSPEALPRARSLDPDVTRWLPLPDVDTALMFDAFEVARYDVDADARVYCEALRKRRADLGAMWWMIADHCKSVVTWPDVGEVKLDHTSAGALAITAVSARLSEGDASRAAEEITALRLKETSVLGRAQLALTEAALRQGERASAPLLSALRLAPRDPELWVGLQRVGSMDVLPAFAAWAPGLAGAWLAAAEVSEPKDQRPIFEHAYVLGGRDARNAFSFAFILLEANELDEVRAMAARYAGGPPRDRVASEYLLARVDLRQGRFLHALERLRATVDSAGEYGDETFDAQVIASDLMSIGRFLGRQQEVADEWTRSVLLQASRVAFPITSPAIQSQAISACALASPRVSESCFAFVEACLSDGRFSRSHEIDVYLRGARAFASRDLKTASRLWRGLLGSALEPYLLVEAFDGAGLGDIASGLDGLTVTTHAFGGVSEAHLREALRAKLRGEGGKATELSRAVIAACSSADAEPLNMTAIRDLAR